jgi:hypothetical protein
MDLMVEWVVVPVVQEDSMVVVSLVALILMIFSVSSLGEVLGVLVVLELLIHLETYREMIFRFH